MQILVPMEQAWGLEPLALVVHNKFGWAVVPQMWAFSPHTTVLSMPWPEPTAVAQVVRRKLLLWTRTSFWHSPEFGFGKKHWQCCLVMVELQLVLNGVLVVRRLSL